MTGLGKGVLFSTINGKKIGRLDEISNINLTCEEHDSDLTVKYFDNKEFVFESSIELPKNLDIFFLTGKELFVKCPKKIRRSRKFLTVVKDYRKLKTYDRLSEIDPDCWDWIGYIGREDTRIIELYLLAFELAQEQLKNREGSANGNQ